MSIFTLLFVFVAVSLAVVASSGALLVVWGFGDCRNKPVWAQALVAVLCAVIATLAWSYVVVTM